MAEAVVRFQQYSGRGAGEKWWALRGVEHLGWLQVWRGGATHFVPAVGVMLTAPELRAIAAFLEEREADDA